MSETQGKDTLNERSFTKPRKVTLDASTVCQLKCQTCPTSKGIIKRNIGSGFLTFDHFKRFIDDHPWISEIELSNWGEVFLNPDLIKVLEYAYENQVKLGMSANLNTVSAEVLEGLVRFKVQSLTCSVDGASQEVYSIYRVNGNFDQVIKNIKKINEFKIKYDSPLPRLHWQFVTFGHNEHEIAKARHLAKELNMSFNIKLSWDDLYFDAFSPVKDRDLIKLESGLDVADRQEYEEKYKKSYIQECCLGLWLFPRINFDGKLLGCCINHWGDYGNVFETSLEECLNGEKINYAREMLMGLKEKREDIPCSKCKVYASRIKYLSFVVPDELEEEH